MTDPNCPWCKGTGYLEEEDPTQSWNPAAPPESGGAKCPSCNPYGTSKPFSDAEMDALVSRPPTQLEGR